MILEKWKQALLYGGLDRDTFEALQPEIWRENRRGLKHYSLLATVVFAALTDTNFFISDVTAVNQISYSIMTVVNALVFLGVCFITPRHPRVTVPLAYCFMLALYAFSLRITLLHPDLPAVTTIVLMFALPFLMMDKPIRLVALTAVVVAGLLATSFCYKPAGIASMDMWNVISFGAIAAVVEVIQQHIRFRALDQAGKVQYLSETDLLTGAKNRNCYERRQDDYARSCSKNMICVYIDVNGLHDLNDTKGHKAGDVMLQSVARKLIDCFSATHTYRIGGDEFVAFRTDGSLEATKEEMARTAAELLESGYYISTGIAAAEKESLSIAALIAEAETYMYQEKRKYYAKIGGRSSRH